MSPEAERDRQLARRAAAGDDSAWREIYESTCQRLFNLLCWQVGDREAARDLLQDTYLAAARGLGRYEGEAPLICWLRGIALRRARDWKRRLWRSLRTARALAREADPPVAPASEGALDLESKAFRAALARLSGAQRSALLLHELEGLPFAEIARELGCGEATARVHHHRALQRLRSRFGPGREPLLAGGVGGRKP